MQVVLNQLCSSFGLLDFASKVRPGMLAYVIHPQNTKNRLCVCARCTLWYDSVRFIETTTCQ